MKPLPFRLRIALFSTVISGVVLVAFGVVTWLLIYGMRIEAVDRDIRTLGSRHPGWFTGRGKYERLPSSLEFTFGTEYTNQIILLIKDSEGRTSYRSPHWPSDMTPDRFAPQLEAGYYSGTSDIPATNTAAVDSEPPDSGSGHGGWGRGMGLGGDGQPSVIFNKTPYFFTAVVAETRWRLGVLGNDEVTLVIGLNQQEVENELNHLRAAFLITLPVALSLVALGGWVVAGRALRPLKTIAETAEQVTARGLSQRIPDSGESPEVGRVVQVLNLMMDRLEASFRQAIRFSADASHELKTPLTIMQGELENALQTAASGSSEQELFSNLLEETQRLKTITRSLLLLAQADAGQLKLTLESVDLSVDLENMIEDARVLAADLRLIFEVQVEAQQRVMADRALLHTAMFNLIVNAIKHNESKGTISLALTATDGQTVFTVCNSGPGIPTEDQPRIFDRFYRIGRASRPGADGIGLGLSLAREIVRAHGGNLALKESCAGRTCFELRINRHA